MYPHLMYGSLGQCASASPPPSKASRWVYKFCGAHQWHRSGWIFLRETNGQIEIGEGRVEVWGEENSGEGKMIFYLK